MRFTLILILATLTLALPIAAAASYSYPHSAVDGVQAAVFFVGAVIALVGLGVLVALEKLIAQREPAKPAAETK